MKKLWCAGLVMVMALVVVSCATVKPAPKGADLVITNIKMVADEKILEGSPFAFEFTVKNQGTDATPAVEDPNSFSLPRIMVYIGDETLAMSQPISAIKAGEEVVLKTEIFKNGSFPAVEGKVSIGKAGDYKLTAIIDPAGYLEEVSKDNNTAEVKVKIEPKPKEEKK